jgi:peptide-methionine (S)-S-oxide reductase
VKWLWLAILQTEILPIEMSSSHQAWSRVVRAIRLKTGSLLALALPLLVPNPHPQTAKATAVLAGGCFWGVEAVYEHVRGVKSVVSGYAVPAENEPTMKPAKGEYVEAVRIEYDPGQIGYARLLEIFFSVAHDPTQGDRQGPDIGREYRSVILVGSDVEEATARAFVDSLRTTGVFSRPITTEIATLKSFKVAEPFHQDYVARNPRSPYVVANDAPKLEHLRQQFPDLYR